MLTAIAPLARSVGTGAPNPRAPDHLSVVWPGAPTNT